MKKFFMWGLAVAVFMCSTAVFAEIVDWQNYHGKLVATGDQVRDNFYLDPLQPIADLTRAPLFNQVTINTHSLMKIAFPNYYLIILTLDNVPANTAPPDTQPVYIGPHTFYLRHSWDAGMCHNYDYYTYFLEHRHQYYAFIFLITSDCFANQNAAEKRYVDIREFERILGTFSLK